MPSPRPSPTGRGRNYTASLHTLPRGEGEITLLRSIRFHGEREKLHCLAPHASPGRGGNYTASLHTLPRGEGEITLPRSTHFHGERGKLHCLAPHAPTGRGGNYTASLNTFLPGTGEKQGLTSSGSLSGIAASAGFAGYRAPRRGGPALRFYPDEGK